MSRPFTPRPYQLEMTKFILKNDRCNLFVPMGLGKTTSVLMALDILNLVNTGKTLIIAPLRVAKSTWPSEIQKWDQFSHLTISVIGGSAKERTAAIKRDADIYSVNYENLEWLVQYFGESWPFRTVVADEVTRLKGFRLRQGSVRAKALGKVAHTKVTRFIGLTGTPTPNGIESLWALTWFVDAGVRLGRTYLAFTNRWFIQSYDGFGLIPHKHSQAEVEKLISDVCVSLDPKDYFDIKDPIMINVEVTLPEAAMTQYKAMEEEMFAEFDGQEVEAFSTATKTLKCLQIANGAIYTGEDSSQWSDVHDEKLRALESIVEESVGAPILVAYHFKSDLARLQKAFPHGRALDKDPATIDAWNAGKIPLLFCHPMSAGHGLSLQDGGNILVFFGHWWNLEERLQVIERIGPTRQAQSGYDRPVFIYNLIAKGTVDELVIERIATKKSIQDLLLERMKMKEPTHGEPT
jgi:SNF2 family DNA or RNA helicase